MHVFITGATGWVGSAVVDDLIAAGHRVTGLARSDDKAAALGRQGAEILHATLDDHDALRRGAAAAEAVIHTAFNHDFSKFTENAEQDRRVIEVLGAALEGSGRPLLVTSGLSGFKPGAVESDIPAAVSPRRSEQAAEAVRARGGRIAVVRLAPSVHGVGEFHGFVPILLRLARETGVSAYPGEGENRWSAVHRRDAARIYRLALETGMTEPAYHAVAEDELPMREIAAMIGRKLGLPIESRGPDHFGWFARMAGADMAASAARTRAVLGWQPMERSLAADLDDPRYTGVAS